MSRTSKDRYKIKGEIWGRGDIRITDNAKRDASRMRRRQLIESY